MPLPLPETLDLLTYSKNDINEKKMNFAWNFFTENKKGNTKIFFLETILKNKLLKKTSELVFESFKNFLEKHPQ
jgi:hypothetical protein